MSKSKPTRFSKTYQAALDFANASERTQTRIGHLIGVGAGMGKPEVGYMARMLVICTMPHTDQQTPGGASIKRTNGDYTLYIQPAPDKGVPYGMYPRLIMAWMTQEVQRTRQRELNMGRSFTEFMREVGVTATTGKRGTMKNMREQIERLLSSRIWMTYEDEEQSSVRTINVADEWDLWWQPRHGIQQDSLFPNRIVLGQKLFEDMLKSPVPFDKRVIRSIRSPLAFDLYLWLGWRMSYLQKPTMLSYEQLAEQLGADYSNPKNFARAVRKQLGIIRLAWDGLRVETPYGRIALYPSGTHVPKRLTDS